MSIPFEAIDSPGLPATLENGTTGTAIMRIVQHEGFRTRMAEYSANHLADFWFPMGHLIFVLEGELINEHEDGRVNVLKAGMSYHESDGLSSHRSRSIGAVKLIVVDGEFLK